MAGCRLGNVWAQEWVDVWVPMARYHWCYPVPDCATSKAGTEEVMEAVGSMDQLMIMSGVAN